MKHIERSSRFTGLYIALIALVASLIGSGCTKKAANLAEVASELPSETPTPTPTPTPDPTPNPTPTPTPDPWVGKKLLGASGQTTVPSGGSAVDADGNIFIGGYTDGNLDSSTYAGSEMHIFVTKYNSSGVLQWTRLTSAGPSSSTAAYGITVDPDGNVIVSGVSSAALPGLTAPNGGPFLIKYNTSGVKQWSVQVDHIAWGTKVAADSSGNLILSGMTWEAMHGNTLTGVVDLFLVKFDSAGNRLWTRQFGPPNPASGAMDILNGGGIVTDSADNIYLAASTEGDMWGNGSISGAIDSVLVKYNASGTQQWIKQFGASGTDTLAASLAIDASDNLIMTGYTVGNLAGETKTGLHDLYVTKYDSSGTRLWLKLLGGTGANVTPGGVSVDADGNVYAAGGVSGGAITGSLTGTTDVFLAKYNSSGALQWVQELGPSGATATTYGVNVNDDGDIFMTGFTSGSFTGGTVTGIGDAFIFKFNNQGVLQ